MLSAIVCKVGKVSSVARELQKTLAREFNAYMGVDAAPLAYSQSVHALLDGMAIGVNRRQIRGFREMIAGNDNSSITMFCPFLCEVSSASTVQ